ncbi:hypothetical protein [Sphingomonas spermidinifaciens]|uniref:hypothetical protein n=1 Tax=Sphingomonas spermidinifaciens TaxID=1141889 RepID=UPI001143E12D|nr:hypothetical protein [Sphingomonas spermidinifaciens]
MRPDRREVLLNLVAAYSQPLTRYFHRKTAAPDEVPDLLQEAILRLSRMNDPEAIRERASPP